MLETLEGSLPGYFPELRRLSPLQWSCIVRATREFAREAAFLRRATEPSRHYGEGLLMEGRYAVFAERDPTEPIKGGLPRKARVSAASEASGLGLSSIPIWKSPQGMQGLTPRMAKEVRHELWALEPLRRRMAVPLVTLPTEVLRDLDAIPGGWERFRKRYLYEWTRRLKAAGLDPLWTGVTELQPKRSASLGMPCPHIHLAVVNRVVRENGSLGGWVVKPKHHDAMIRSALYSATGKYYPKEMLKTAGSLQKLRGSVVAYIGKYFSKGGDAVRSWNSCPDRGLYIRTWRFSSRACKARAEAHRPRLHGEFGRFCRDYDCRLEEMGLLRVKELPEEDGKPPLLLIRRLRRDGIHVAWRMWRELDVERAAAGDRLAVKWRPSSDWLGSEPSKADSAGVVTVSGGRDEVSFEVGPVPSGYFDSDDSGVSMQDRIHGPLADVLKERLEFIYREVDVAEPVFLPAVMLGHEGQLELPLDVRCVGSAWDVGVADSWDPYWDDPGWRGGPPR